MGGRGYPVGCERIRVDVNEEVKKIKKIKKKSGGGGGFVESGGLGRENPLG